MPIRNKGLLSFLYYVKYNPNAKLRWKADTPQEMKDRMRELMSKEFEIEDEELQNKIIERGYDKIIAELKGGLKEIEDRIPNAEW